MKHAALVALCLATLGACKTEEAARPEPVEMTAEALSHYCLMQIDEHPGPKAQVHLEGYPVPIFFAQVRDALAYVKGPEREAEITAFYVNDMGAAGASWAAPGAHNWREANTMHFVVGADVTGGMGAPEIVPFGGMSQARDFAAQMGGDVLTLDAIAPEIVLAPVEITGAAETDS